MSLIDADYVKSKLNKSALGGHLHYYVCGVIDDAPTIDAEPVRHGRWIFANDGYVRCSECTKKAPYFGDDCAMTDYCPHCGAKMDLKDGESDG